MTNKEVVSRIRNSVKATTKDDHISSRYILSIARAKARTAMTSAMHLYELMRLDHLFKTVRCIEMVKQDVIDCGVVELKRCKKLMRSKKKFPGLFTAKYGALIRNVMTIDGSTSFDPVTKTTLTFNSKRSHYNIVKQNLYYISDGYLYLPDSEIEMIDLEVMGFSESEVAAMSGCKDEADQSKCISPLDDTFICPDKFIDTVITTSTQEIVGTWKSIPTDENPNMDSNIKSSTVR